jgi:hypothetical protein
MPRKQICRCQIYIPFIAFLEPGKLKGMKILIEIPLG